MSKGATHWGRECYGLDLHGDQPIVVRAVRGRTRVRFDEASGVETNAPVAGCLSCRESFTRWLEAPFGSVRKAARVFATLLDIQLPFPLAECIYDFSETARTEHGRVRTLAAAARLTDAQRRLGEYLAAGVDPVVLDQEGMAIWHRALVECPPGDGDATLRAVVYFGSARAAMSIGRGPMLLATHGMGRADPALLRRLLKAQEAATAPAGNSDERITWIVCGPGAANDADVAALKRGLEPGPGDSWQVVDAPRTFLARAVASRALLGGPLAANFRTGVLAHEGLALRGRRRVSTAAGVLLTAGMLLCATNLGLRLMATRVAGQARADVSALADAVAGYRLTAKGADAVRMAADEVVKRRHAYQPFVAAMSPSLGVTLADVIQSASSARLRLDVLSLSPGSVEIAGSGPAWNSADRVFQVLKKDGFPVTLTRHDALADESIPFVIETAGDGL